MPPMIRAPAFRFFLILALLLNGLVTAHAAAAHAGMALPVAAMSAAAAAAEEGCHDMAAHNAVSDAPVRESPHSQGHDHHGGLSCCQGTVCNCACALQLPVSPSVVMRASLWQPVPPASIVDAYLSVTPSLILRPPIA